MKNKKRIIPKFATEAEEAKWWFKNREAHGKLFLAAIQNGDAKVLTKERLLARVTASRNPPATVVALRIPKADIDLARRQAEQEGVPYQTYIKSLLHETLMNRERQKAG